MHPHRPTPRRLLAALALPVAAAAAIVAHADGRDPAISAARSARVAARAAARAHLRLSPQAVDALRGTPTARQRRKAALGLRIFRDRSLSEPAGQSCASCHHAERAFSDVGATSAGANPALFGPRNAPDVTYAVFTPPLQSGGDEGPLSYFGGLFRDGRADFLSEQAQQPLLNPIEMGNPDVSTVVAKLARAPYAAQFQSLYGPDIFSDDAAAFDAMADAIATFESSPLFASFSSKYDAWLRGETTLNASEARGLAIFNDPQRGNCALCHVSGPTQTWGRHPLLTDFGYDNIGVPRNPDNRFYKMPAQYNPDGWNYVDIGLRNVVSRDAVIGQFKAPSLRNVAVSAPYMHNGYFRTLRGVVEFYNTRDVWPTCADPYTREADALAQQCWPVAESPASVNHVDMGDLHLSEQDVDDLVAFMRTLTDGWSVPGATRARGGCDRRSAVPPSSPPGRALTPLRAGA